MTFKLPSDSNHIQLAFLYLAYPLHLRPGRGGDVALVKLLDALAEGFPLDLMNF